MNNEKEEQRYGRNKDTIVNLSYISSGEYRRKFDLITDDTGFARLLYFKAKEMLTHRSGTMMEDMCWFDLDKKSLIANMYDMTEESKVTYSSGVLKAINGRGRIMTMHTHPHSMPPSIEDFNASCYYGYDEGIVLCHDGTVYKYSSDEIIKQYLYSKYIEEYLLDGESERNSQLCAIRELSRNYDIWLEEVR